MKILGMVEGFIFGTARWKFILMMFGLMIVKTGIWCMPNINAMQMMASNPFVNPFVSAPLAQYLLWSWLGPYLAWVIGATGQWSYFLFLLSFSLAFTFLFIAVVFSRFPDSVARTSIILFMLLPVSVTAYFWVGYDSLVVLLMLLTLVFTRYVALTFLLGVALGMQHFELGILASGALCVALILNQKFKEALHYPMRSSIAWVIGVITGKLILIGLFAHYGMDIQTGRALYAQKHMDVLVMQFFLHSQVILWSVLGLGWVVALKYLDHGRKTIPFFLVLLGLCGFAMFGGDQTRVVAIITFPLVTVYWLLNESFLQSISRKEASFVFALWLMVPFIWVWEGRPKWSVFPYDVTYGLNKLLGWFSVPEAYHGWPFQ